MKTHQEILTEAQRLEEAGRRYWIERRAAGRRESDPRWLMALPDSRFTSEHLGADPVHTHQRKRWIGAALDGDLPEFLLIEDELETNGRGGIVRRVEPFVSLRSESAYDVLRDGYESAEEERLGELLTPYTDRIEEEGFVDSIDPALVEEIEAIVGSTELPPAARMRTRADIIEFLDGSLEPSEFISSAVNRQCFREGERQIVTECHGERMLID